MSRVIIGYRSSNGVFLNDSRGNYTRYDREKLFIKRFRDCECTLLSPTGGVGYSQDLYALTYTTTCAYLERYGGEWIPVYSNNGFLTEQG